MSNTLLLHRRLEFGYPDIAQQPNEIWFQTIDGSEIPSVNTYYNNTQYVPNVDPIAVRYYNGYGRLIYKNPVTTINSNAFRANTLLTKIIFPSSVTTLPNSGNIGIGCTALTAYEVQEGNPNYCSVDGVLFTKDIKTLIAYPRNREGTTYEVSSGVTTIGQAAFYGNTKLTNVTLPDGLITISGSSFNGCTKLKSPVFPSTLTSIGSYAFQSCQAITTITIPNSVTNIGEYAFYHCNYLSRLVVGSGVTVIPTRCFAYLSRCGSITLPNTLKRIEDRAFEGSNAVSNISLPEGLTFIGNFAFNSTVLQEWNIPSTVTTVGEIGYIGRTARFTVASGNTHYAADDDGASFWEINSQGKKIKFKHWAPSRSGELFIPDTVTEMESYCCADATGLTKCTISYKISWWGGFDDNKNKTTIIFRGTTGVPLREQRSNFKEAQVPEPLYNSYLNNSRWSVDASKIVSYNPFTDGTYTAISGLWATNSSNFQKIWVCGLDNPITEDYPNGALAAIEANPSDALNIALACGY